MNLVKGIGSFPGSDAWLVAVKSNHLVEKRDGKRVDFYGNSAVLEDASIEHRKIRIFKTPEEEIQDFRTNILKKKVPEEKLYTTITYRINGLPLRRAD